MIIAVGFKVNNDQVIVSVNKNQSILDFGCGTGTLTAQLFDLAGTIVGVDSSVSMIVKAEEQYPNIKFMVCDALDLPFEEEFEVVFSNAVFHWISDHNTLLKQVHKVLKPNGLLVCEFGAKGNIATIENAFIDACRELEYEYKPMFNFPMSENLTKESLWNGNEWIVDYRRLRAIAHI